MTSAGSVVDGVGVGRGVPIAELRSVEIGYGDGPTVIAGADLHVAAGEFLTVIGPSGSGKSTILNVVAGLMPARRGVVMFRGRSVSGINTEVGYMTQGDTLLPWRTVEDNVDLPLKLRKVSRGERRRRVAEVLEMLDLADARRKYPAQLSGGMKRRALLARSMIYEPRMLLMDEPFAALDAQLRGQMHATLRSTVEATGQTVLFVTHDLHEAVLLSDRVVVLGGRPARPIDEFSTGFGRERNLEQLRFEPAFVDLERRVHESLARARGTRVEDQTS